MCGIVGFVGRRPAKNILLEGLSRLEYRGYESAGLVVFNSLAYYCEKEGIGRGSLAALRKRVADLEMPGNSGIGHTRWPTHGGISHENAHPHHDCNKWFWLVHNGTLDNFLPLRKELLERGHILRSETDSELIVHLVEEEFKNSNDFESAVSAAARKLEGAFALAIVCRSEPRKLIALCRSSTLLVGKINVSEGVDYMVASDYAALVDHTAHVVPLQDDEMALITLDQCEYKTFNGEALDKIPISIDLEQGRADLGQYAHYMAKEIFEQPESIVNAFRGRLMADDGLVKLGGLEKDKALITRLAEIDRVIIVACGTAYYAGMIGALYLNSVGLQAEAQLASEFRYNQIVYNPERTLVLAVSQSGETRDTLEAIKEAKRRGALTVGIVNRVGSTLTRSDHSGIYCRAGFEVAVASTKAFTSQLTTLVMLMLYFGREHRAMPILKAQKIIRELQNIPEKIRRILTKENEFIELVERFGGYNNFLLLGRGYSYPVALEGALKIKEVSYAHAEGYSAGEMKHGPIALLDDQMPVMVIAPNDSVFEKTASNLHEVLARNAPLIIITTEETHCFDGLKADIIKVPSTIECLTPLLTVVPLQLFAYHLALYRNDSDPDKPRNLAKSVTVE